MSHLKNVLFVEYHSSAGEIGEIASFIYLFLFSSHRSLQNDNVHIKRLQYK